MSSPGQPLTEATNEVTTAMKRMEANFMRQFQDIKRSLDDRDARSSAWETRIEAKLDSLQRDLRNVAVCPW